MASRLHVHPLLLLQVMLLSQIQLLLWHQEMLRLLKLK
jgi:hypothetical protein